MAPSKPSKPRRTPKPTVREKTEAMAAEGKLAKLIEAVSTGWPSQVFGADEKMQLVREAISKHANGGAVSLADAAFKMMVEHDLAYLARAQMSASQKLSDLDSHTGRHPANLPPPLVEELERIVSIEDRIMHLLQTFSRIRHVLTLSEAAANPINASSSAMESDLSVEKGKVISFEAAVAAMKKRGS